MKNKIIILGLLLNIAINSILAQDNYECSIRALSDKTEAKVISYLDRRSKLINLHFKENNEELLSSPLFKEYIETEGIIYDKSYLSVNQSIDSLIIVLDNGLEWNLELEPPKEPKRFYSRMVTKREKKQKAILDRIHYLQFCSKFDSSNTTPCTVQDIYIVYSRVTVKDIYVLKAKYKINLKQDTFELIELSKE